MSPKQASKGATQDAPRGKPATVKRKSAIDGCVTINYPCSTEQLIEFNEAFNRAMQSLHGQLEHCFEDDEYPPRVPPSLNDLGDEYADYSDVQKSMVLSGLIKDHVIRKSKDTDSKATMCGELMSLLLEEADNAVRSHEKIRPAAVVSPCAESAITAWD